jgi:hypothetical protein
MSNITIEAWLDSGANEESTYWVEFEVDEAEWSAMSEEERDEYAKEYAWGRMDWGWTVKEKST